MSEFVLEKIKEYYLEMLPFNKILWIDIDLLDYETGDAVTSFNMTHDLVGNSTMGILHGGGDRLCDRFDRRPFRAYFLCRVPQGKTP